MYVCMYVCMYVRNGFTIEIYGFMHSLRSFWHVLSLLSMVRWRGMEIEVEDSEDRSIDNTVRTSVLYYL